MMSMIWRFFPGPAWVRIIVILAACAALAYVVINFVYPWVALQFPESEVTITQ